MSAILREALPTPERGLHHAGREPLPPALPPGSVIGVLGNGQLGRMMALAAAPLGYRVHIYDPRPGPATQVTDLATFGAWDDRAALDRFAAAVHVVTWEFENVPADTARHLAERVPVRPGVNVLATCQDRIQEKSFLNAVAEVPTTHWRRASTADEAARACAELGPCVIKTSRSGYDGRGQRRAANPDAAAAAWTELAKGAPRFSCIVEALVPFIAELSVLIARGADGRHTTWDVCWNDHHDHILRTTRVPAPFPAEALQRAVAIAERVARTIELVGLLAVELFLCADGSVLVNELAPRPHNSGHWTIDAAFTSQFEQVIRAVAGLPLGDTARHHDARMTNLIGDDMDELPVLRRDPSVRVHLYGKPEVRPNRKMGHYTQLYPRSN
jgi:5-(carboxyamino)imidazole ribonucleotide synthase